MKKKGTILFVTLISALIFIAKANAQLDTTGGRFINKIFDTVSVVPDQVYASGLYANGSLGELKMDIYQPSGDTMSQRPVIVLAHGGGFIQGNKIEMENACRQFSKRGYVTVSIQYRLGYTALTSPAIVEMVIRATQDMKNAIRFLRKSATLGNPYRIHPELIFCGGFSAGAITALHLGYMDELNEIPPGQAIPDLDSLHNSNQIPGYDWKPKAIINIAGAVGDTNWMTPEGIPVISFHGTSDGTVPYISGSFGLPFGPSLNLFGSFSISRRARNLGIRSDLRAFAGAGHDYTITYPWAADTTEARIARFLLPYLLEGSPTATVPKNSFTMQIRFTSGNWLIGGFLTNGQIQIFDFQGRLLFSQPMEAGQSFNAPGQSFSRFMLWKGHRGEVMTGYLPPIH